MAKKQAKTKAVKKAAKKTTKKKVAKKKVAKKKTAKKKAIKKKSKKKVAKKAVKKKAAKKKTTKKKATTKNIMIDLKGADGKIELRLTHDACSYYEDENENITKVLETHHKGNVGDTWQDVVQEAADCWDWEGVINFEAESELNETSRDFKKIEFLNRKGKWQLVPEEVENWYYEAQEKSMDNSAF